MLYEDDYDEILKIKLHKDAHGAKEMQPESSQQLLNCDDVKVCFDRDRKIGDGICCMKMLKQNMSKTTGRIIINPGRISRNS